MKKIITVILAFSMIFALTACGGNGKKAQSPSEIMTSIKKDITFPEMAEIDKASLNGYFEIKTDDIEEMAYIIAGGGATADEVLILKMKDGADINDIKTKVEARKKMQTELFESYSPNEVPKLKSSVVETKGNYIFFAITNDNAKAKKIFNDAV